MKFSRILCLTATAFVLAGCFGTLSKVADDGTSNHLVWPKTEEAKFSYGDYRGSWPNWDNVAMIEAGMDKYQIYNLIGVPHFSEGLAGVREWDYVFNYRENGVHKTCQYKILFDKNMVAQNFFWYPNGCNGSLGFSLSGDLAFAFGKSALTPKGQQVVDSVALKLKGSPVKEVKVAGYTDRIGSKASNLKLSQRRAETVKARLIEKGIDLPIVAVGYGSANPVVACDTQTGKALKDCLKPNRRVEISATGVTVLTSEEAGKTGPTLLYKR